MAEVVNKERRFNTALKRKYGITGKQMRKMMKLARRTKGE